MVKHILWDFDGVIFDSMKIKCDGFKSLFSEYGDEILSQIEIYHYGHGGVSRFDKIRYFYEYFLEKSISDEEVMVLSEKFAKEIEKKLFDKNNLIEESVAFIKHNYQKYTFHIVSGAEHHELNSLCQTFDLSQYFITIEGSPIKKDILIQNILEKYNYKKDETMLIGDAMTDYNAAQKNSIGFYGYNNETLKAYPYIDTFKAFDI
jgi:phosphoglycolate phosphatase-like HAD superfamily hydrolase